MSTPLASEATMKVEGSCHCGKIAYEAMVDPDRVSLCHCTDCQMLTGSAFRVSVPAPKEVFSLLTGQPKIYVKTAESGTRRAHAFCADCGTPVYSSAISDPPTYSLRVGCLAQRALLPPKKQIWCRSALGWSTDLRQVPPVDKQ
jgi:hypothetical protein